MTALDGSGAGAGARVYFWLAMIRVLSIALGVALLIGLPAPAFARPRVAIVAIEGDKSGELADLLAELLENDFSIVGPRATTRAIDKLGYDTDLTSKQLKKLAAELEAEGVIRGDVAKKKSGRKVLHLKLFLNGKKVRGFKVEFASARSEKLKSALKEKLLEKLGGVEAVAEKKPPKKPKGETEGDEPVAEKKPKKKPKKDDEGDEGEGEGESEDDDDSKKKKRVAASDDDESIDSESEGGDGAGVADNPHTANRAAVRVDLGPSLSRRQLSFTSRSFEQAPRPYTNDPVPGGRVEAEIYPLAFGNPNGIASGLGIGGEFDQTLSLNLQSTVQPGTKFPVKQSHWAVGARFRLVIGKKATSPSVTLKAGYASRSFTVDRSKLMSGNIIDLPDVGYKGFTGGAELRFPVGGRAAIFAGGGGVFVTTTGAIQTAAQYGQAKVTGAEARVGVDISITKRLALKLMGEFTQMGFAFTGTGEMSNNRDGDPATKDVGGAADRYIGGSLLFGVLY